MSASTLSRSSGWSDLRRGRGRRATPPGVAHQLRDLRADVERRALVVELVDVDDERQPLDDLLEVESCHPDGVRSVRREMKQSAGPGVAQAVARLEQVLRQHLHVGEHGHEARVAGPAGHDVEVHVVDDAGSGDAAEVPAEVEAAARTVARRAAMPWSPRWCSSSAVSSPSSRARRRARTERRAGGRTSTGTCSGARTRSPAVDDEPLLDLAGGLGAEEAAGSSSAWATYSSRHGAQSCFGIAILSTSALPADDTKVSSTAAKPTCVVADDHPPVLESVSRFLELQGFRVVGRARNGEEAIALVESQRPSLAVLDLRMPGLAGAAVIRRVARTTPQCSCRRLLRLRRRRPAERSARRGRAWLRAQGRAARRARSCAPDRRRRPHVHRSGSRRRR